ncbi:MAG: biliverdin-producing heme oxygenase [Hyphomicrobium aestuarii]|nr:biliverdin-producing heme oxygenase [Hyphomicrobium aestuarii]
MSGITELSPTDTTDQTTLPPQHLRELLRSSTSEIHQRLHGHSGLAAVQSGTISRAAYTALLRRLYGFHRSFEAAAQIAPDRTRWLEIDLAALGVTPEQLAAVPMCTAFPVMPCPDYVLGARYVVEGSALGGRGLARQLDGLLGCDVVAGRQFFAGSGTDTGAVWRNYLAELSATPRGSAQTATIVAGANATFAIFEQWLEGWDDNYD